jgi:seryl-tRNA synthetase
LLNDSVPEGKGASENVIVATLFEERRLLSSGSGKNSVSYLSHDDVARSNGWMDLDAANRMSGKIVLSHW